MHRFESHQERVSIGRPIANTQVYILDGQYRLLPPGVPGDLYIGGQGLSAGYWNRPQLTEERFIPHPFEKGQKLYRTGDIGRWLPDGNLELLGREDRQVKISGYRIELGEIESCLLAARGVREAAVLVEEKGGEKLLAAYYVSDQPVDAASLKGYLAQKLPAYMIPARYTWMREMPLTPNGKTDLKALPGAGSDAGDVLLRRESDIAKVLAGIWSEILSIDEEAISIHANFFELGGHSINIIKLNTLVNERFNSNIPLVEMYRLPTIQSLEDFILNGERYDDPAGRTDMEAELAEANDIIGLMEGNNN
jgi:lichenysin synthetase A